MVVQDANKRALTCPAGPSDDESNWPPNVASLGELRGIGWKNLHVDAGLANLLAVLGLLAAAVALVAFAARGVVVALRRNSPVSPASSS